MRRLSKALIEQEQNISYGRGGFVEECRVVDSPK